MLKKIWDDVFVSDDDRLEELKSELKPPNSGCEISQSKQMTTVGIMGDGNCLFNSVSLAMEGTVDKPD